MSVLNSDALWDWLSKDRVDLHQCCRVHRQSHDWSFQYHFNLSDTVGYVVSTHSTVVGAAASRDQRRSWCLFSDK